MGSNDISINSLSFINLKRHPFRTAGLIILVSVLSFLVFGGTIISLSLNRGLESISSRLGADIMVVPLGYDEEAEGILIRGEPSYFYFDKSVEKQISEVEGVEKVTSQFFLTSSNQDCCSVPVQFIGFDPDTDFSVQPWIKQNYQGNIADGAVIMGNDIQLDDQSDTMKFFDKEYTVAAVLEETGTSFDSDVYANMDTVKDIFAAAKAKGFSFTNDIDIDNSISSVLIKISDGYDIDTVVHNIRVNVDGIQIIKGKTMTSDIADNLGSFKFFALFMLAVIGIFSVIVLIMTFAISANERRKEFGILRSLGADKGMTSSVIIREALIIGGLGGLTGTFLAAVVIFPFNTYIGDSVSLPYLLPDIPVILTVFAVTIILSLTVPPLTAAYSAVKISRAETYLIMRDND